MDDTTQMLDQRLTRIENKLDDLSRDVAEMRGAQDAKSRTQVVVAGIIGAAVGGVPAVISFFRGH